MAFMKPEILENVDVFEVTSASGDVTIIPFDLLNDENPSADSFALYLESGSIAIDWEVKRNVCIARMSASGYLDCTSWSIHTDKQQAMQYLVSTYMSD